MNPRLTDPIEILFLSLMYRWETTAPADQHHGLLDDLPEINCQTSRLAFVLDKIATGQSEHVFNVLARYTSRGNGSSFVAKTVSMMTNPKRLAHGWFLEGCASLPQKQWILQKLSHLGFSAAFIRSADDFVAGKSIARYFPTEDECRDLLETLEAESMRKVS